LKKPAPTGVAVRGHWPDAWWFDTNTDQLGQGRRGDAQQRLGDTDGLPEIVAGEAMKMALALGRALTETLPVRGSRELVKVGTAGHQRPAALHHLLRAWAGEPAAAGCGAALTRVLPTAG
jgi:hypothetical protein